MILVVFFLTALIGAVGGAVIKFTLGEFPQMVLIFFRGLIATLTLLSILYFGKINFTSLKLKRYLFASCILFSLNWVLFAFGIENTSVTMGQLIYLPTSIIVAVVGYFSLREKLNSEQIVGLIVTIIGLIILFLGSIATNDPKTFGQPIGNLIIFLGLISWSLYTITSRKISHVYHPLQVTFFNVLTITIISFIIAILTGSFVAFKPQSVNLPGLWGLIWIGTINSVGFFGLYQYLIKNTSAFTASLILYPTTILAGIVGVIFFQERLTINLLIGGFTVMLGVFIANTLKHVKKYVSR